MLLFRLWLIFQHRSGRQWGFPFMPAMFSVAWHLSKVEGIWQFGFLATACHPGIPQSKALSDMPFLHCLARNVQYVKTHCCPFHIVYYQIPFCCIVFFHKLLNIVEKKLYLDWPQALSKFFCSFNNVLIVGMFCAPVEPFAWNHPWEIALSMVEPGKLSFKQENSWIASCWHIYFCVSPYSQPFLAVTLASGDCWKLACWGGAALWLF